MSKYSFDIKIIPIIYLAISLIAHPNGREEVIKAMAKEKEFNIKIALRQFSRNARFLTSQVLSD